MTQQGSTSEGARIIEVGEEWEGQRIDNFLMRELKGLPKSRIYSMLRKGEVRVNGGRRKAPYRLQTGDKLRLPPVTDRRETSTGLVSGNLEAVLKASVVFEDSGLLVINKPSGLAVHGGSGISVGLVEALRVMRPESRVLELVHRLDRDTSGLIMLAKKRGVLTELHRQLREGHIEKCYLAAVAGSWPTRKTVVKEPLEKFVLQSGERLVRVSLKGKSARTEFECLKRGEGVSLLRAKPITGRTHQIRVHCNAAGHPILGDTKYGDEEANSAARERGLTRLFLHAESLKVTLNGHTHKWRAEPDSLLSSFIDSIG